MPDILPKKKPYTEDMFKKDADLYIKGFLGGFPKGEMNQLLKQKISKIEDEGVMSSDEAKDFIKERAYYLKEFVKENPGKTLPELKADGGRIGFLKGGDTKYNAMVFRMYTEAGGKEGTGMDIDSFAEKYFPKMAQGGRIGYGMGDLVSNFVKTNPQLFKAVPESKKVSSSSFNNISGMGGMLGKLIRNNPEIFMNTLDEDEDEEDNRYMVAQGGRIGFQEGSLDPDTMALKEKIEDIMDLEGLDFGEAFKKALREIKAEARDISD